MHQIWHGQKQDGPSEGDPSEGDPTPTTSKPGIIKDDLNPMVRGTDDGGSSSSTTTPGAGAPAPAGGNPSPDQRTTTDRSRPVFGPARPPVPAAEPLNDTDHPDYVHPYGFGSEKDIRHVTRDDMPIGHHLRKTQVTESGTAPGMLCHKCLDQKAMEIWLMPYRECHVCRNNHDMPSRYERPELFSYSKDTKFRVKK